MRKSKLAPAGGSLLLAVCTLLILPGLLTAQALFTFSVEDLEAYDRSGNWIYDADGPTFPTHDGNWFTYGDLPGYPYHYFGEKYIHQGAPTSLVCVGENTPLADNPGQIGISFTGFNLVAFKRINTVDPLAAWNIPGQSGDERVYSNASGIITYNGNPVLSMDMSTFVITTPYPSEAQIQALSPLLAGWTGSIGSGAPQTGYGFGDLDLANCDPAWAALFAASDYKVHFNMVGIVSTATVSAGYFDFALEILPADIPNETANEYITDTGEPQTIEFPSLGVGVDITDAVPGGMNDDMLHIYLNEILVAPGGTLPDGLDFTSAKYWELGTTMTSFNVNLRFTLDSADFGKSPLDWRILYRQSALHPWTPWQDYTLLSQQVIRANNVTQIGEFTIGSREDEPTPVEIAYGMMQTSLNSDSQAVLTWVTSSETGLIGFKVLANTANDLASAICLNPIVIPAQNNPAGATYSFTASELTEPGTYYFWLESLGVDGSSQFFGPAAATVPQDQSPALPQASALGKVYPNPFRQGQPACIDVDVKEGDSGILSVYNIAGQKISSYPLQAGSHTVVWNGRDSQGRICASGIYFYRLDTQSVKVVRRMVILK